MKHKIELNTIRNGTNNNEPYYSHGDVGIQKKAKQCAINICTRCCALKFNTKHKL